MEDNFWGEVIYSYTRKQALEDGVLIDVTPLAKECGFRYHTAITAGVFERLNDIPEGSGQDFQGRLWDLLTVMKYTVKGNPGDTDRVDFKILIQGEQMEEQEFYALVGPGDTADPVITIMLPWED